MFRKIDSKIFDDDLSLVRDYKLKNLIEYSNYKESYIEGYCFNLFESLGYNSSMKIFSDLISDEIYLNLGKNHDDLKFPLIIKQLGILSIEVSFINNDQVSIKKVGNLLKIDFGYSDIKSLSDVEVKIYHELHHIFINQMGNKTHKNYFIVNDLIPKYNGRTKAFLSLYYLSFPDEISANIQMMFRNIGRNNVKNKKEFLLFLGNCELYKISQKMIDFDVLKYWNLIIEEGNDSDIIKELDIKNLEEFLTKTSSFIRKAGKEYKRRLSRIFI